MWKRVASLLPNKTNQQCRLKYESLSSEMNRKACWTVEEDIRVQVLVHILGRVNWVRVARYIPQVSLCLTCL